MVFNILAGAALGGLFSGGGSSGERPDYRGAAYHQNQAAINQTIKNARALGRARFAGTPGAGVTLAGLRGQLQEARDLGRLDPALEAAIIRGVREQSAETARAGATGTGGLTRASSARNVALGEAAIGQALTAREGIRIQREVLRFDRTQAVLQSLAALTQSGFQGAPLEATLGALNNLQAARIAADAQIQSINIQAAAERKLNPNNLLAGVGSVLGGIGGLLGD